MKDWHETCTSMRRARLPGEVQTTRRSLARLPNGPGSPPVRASILFPGRSVCSPRPCRNRLKITSRDDPFAGNGIVSRAASSSSRASDIANVSRPVVRGRIAVAPPMPRVPPVTNATFPERSHIAVS